ncbi:unnamed protein product [Amoebophrya sp. A25]|nr:unnamed protein product [Amoebophrya sp. A25]|eukprot:GSA25T00001623001.1
MFMKTTRERKRWTNRIRTRRFFTYSHTIMKIFLRGDARTGGKTVVEAHAQAPLFFQSHDFVSTRRELPDEGALRGDVLHGEQLSE